MKETIDGVRSPIPRESREKLLRNSVIALNAAWEQFTSDVVKETFDYFVEVFSRETPSDPSSPKNFINVLKRCPSLAPHVLDRKMRKMALGGYDEDLHCDQMANLIIHGKFDSIVAGHGLHKWATKLATDWGNTNGGLFLRFKKT